jgi:hypothetical protein
MINTRTGRFEYGKLLYGGWYVEFTYNGFDGTSLHIIETNDEEEAKAICNILNSAIGIEERV